MAELTENFDWSEWEDTYHGWLGQPPIHPRILACLWLYGHRPKKKRLKSRSMIPTRESCPAIRADLTQQVPERLWIELPLSPQTKKLGKSCFVYDEQLDRYVCPMGQILEGSSGVPGRLK